MVESLVNRIAVVLTDVGNDHRSGIIKCQDIIGADVIVKIRKVINTFRGGNSDVVIEDDMVHASEQNTDRLPCQNQFGKVWRVNRMRATSIGE